MKLSTFPPDRTIKVCGSLWNTDSGKEFFTEKLLSTTFPQATVERKVLEIIEVLPFSSVSTAPNTVSVL